MVTADLLLKLSILAVVPALTLWGMIVIHKGRVTLTLPAIPGLSGRNARLAGLMAVCEAAAGLSFVMGHTTSAVTMMTLTLLLFCWVVSDELVSA